VKANTADASLELTSYEITDITESISNLTLAFTDAVLTSKIPELYW
jgi:hypothetical protein